MIIWDYKNSKIMNYEVFFLFGYSSMIWYKVRCLRVIMWVVKGWFKGNVKLILNFGVFLVFVDVWGSYDIL